MMADSLMEKSVAHALYIHHRRTCLVPIIHYLSSCYIENKFQHTRETGLQRHKSLFPVIWGKLSAGLRLTRRSFLPLLIELSRALSYIILRALPNIIFTYGIMAHICRNNGADFRIVIATILSFPAPGFIILGTKLLLCSFNENSLW